MADKNKKKPFDPDSLPNVDDPAYIELAVDACIEVFQKLQDNSLAMDYVGVPSKLRSVILGNERYKRETKRMKAKLIWEEIEDIEEMDKELKNSAPDPTSGSYDIRDPKSVEEFTKDVKETLALRLKVKQTRRELLSISREDAIEETNALNVYFIPLTEEGFRQMQNVEIHEGSDDVTIKEESTDDGPVKSIKSSITQDESFFIEEDGTITE